MSYMIGIGLNIIKGTSSRLSAYKQQIAAISGAVVNDDGLAIYDALAAALKSSAALYIFPYAYKGNTVYAMDATGNPVAMTHSRGSNATYFDNTGKLNYATHNLVQYSEQFDNAAWTKTTGCTVTANAAIAPDGTMTADQLNIVTSQPFENTIYQAGAGLTPIANSYDVNVWVKGTAGQQVYLIATDGGSLLSSRSTQNQLLVTFNGNWQLIKQQFKVPTSGGTGGYIGLTVSGFGANPNLSAVSFYAWGAYVRRVPSPDVYVQTTSSAVYCPRFDYTPNSLAYNGLMIERVASTNLCLKSDPTSAEGSSSNVSYSAYAWPCGMMVNAVVYGTSGVDRSYSAGTSTSATYVFSAYVIMDDAAAPVVGTNTTTGDMAIIIGGSLCSTVGVIPCGGNVYRVWGTRTASNSFSSNGILKYATQSSRSFKVSGFQLEIGAYPTSYIPTFGSTATRASDTFASVADVIPYTEASIYINQAVRKNQASTYVIRGTQSDGRIWYDNNATIANINAQTYDGTNVATAATGSNNAGVFEKAITTYGSAGLKMCRGGAAVASAPFDGIMGTAGALQIGDSGTTLYYLKAIVIVPRQFSDTEMQNATS